MSCIKPFTELHLTKEPDGMYRYSTCVYGEVMRNSSIDFYNDPTLNRIRDAHKAGVLPEECKHCKAHPEHITPNTTNITEPILKRFMLGIGNVCNLACVICGSHTSTTWARLYKGILEYNLPYRFQNTIGVRNSAWKGWDLSNVEFSLIGGGEPLLHKEFYELMSAFEDSKELSLFIHLNGTVVPRLDMIQRWKDFKQIKFVFSVDDYGEQFEYIRYPGKWERTVHNMFWLRDNCLPNMEISVNSAVGFLNEQSHLRLVKWLEENYSSDRYGRTIDYLTRTVFGILGMEHFNNNSYEVFTYLNSLDNKRKTNWKKTFPEVYSKYEQQYLQYIESKRW